MQFPHILKSRSGKVAIYQHKRGYRVKYYRGRKLCEDRLTDPDKALTRAQEIFAQLQAGEAARSAKQEKDISYLVACEQMLKDSGADLMTAVLFYLAQHGGGKSLPVPEAVTMFMNAQRGRGLSERHIDTLDSHLSQFKKAFTCGLRSISVAEINEYLGRITHPRTRSNHRVSLGILFHWARDQGYVAPSVETVVDRSDKPKVRRKDPGILSPADMERLLRLAETDAPEIIPYLAIGAFAGVRVAEIQRLRVRDINLPQRIIPLSSDITKTNQRRTAKIPTNLAAWLEKHVAGEPDDLVVKCRVPAAVLKGLCMKLELKWPSNAMRHSFVSYMTQLLHNPSELAEQCGHSMLVNSTNYKNLVTPKDAAAWFNIFPTL